MGAQARDRATKAISVLAGILVMVALVLIAFGVLSRFAGGWGVPYFSFRTQFGGVCTNTFTGFRCDQLTPADVGYYADLTVPTGASVISGRYVTTHDYSLDAVLSLPKEQAAAGLKNATKAFGRCQDRPSALPDSVRTDCVMTNDDFTAQADGQQASRTFTVSTGLAKDGSRQIALTIKSR